MIQRSAVACDPDYERAIVGLIAWLKARELQAHTKAKGGSLIIVPRRRRRSRLDGRPR